LNVEIVGINRSDQAGNNHLVVNDRTLPWLQDSLGIGLWDSWDAVWRDVRIVTSQQELASVYNLTANNLSDLVNRTTLKEQLLSEAVAMDADEDGLRDDWEAIYLQELANVSGAEDDPDGDGHSNFSEFAFGTDPRERTSVPTANAWSGFDEQSAPLQGLSIRRRAGTTVTYGCARSQDLLSWQPTGTDVQWIALEPVYDGTGTFLAYAASPSDNTKNGFFKVEATRN